jgi:glycosyltransferase involved in cell wall biosynthesis
MSRALSVVAIIAAYNESDIIELAVRDLIANGILVYVIDDGSTDDTANLIEPLIGHGVIGIERLPNLSAANGSRTFSLERLVRRKAQLAVDLDADWFINHDADEFRESPWGGVSLLDGIRRVDASGYNAIDFINLDFWPTPDRPDAGNDVRQAFVWYSDAEPYNRVQVRCWRKTSGIEVASTGGHDVQFENRRVFPIRFISRHYPIRGQAHGEQKIFVERRPRFSMQERARQWHVQYDNVQEGGSFIRDICDLTRYDGDAVRTALTLRHRGVEALEVSLAQSQGALDVARCEVQIARRETQTSREESAGHAARVAELNHLVEHLDRELASQREEGARLRANLESRAMELGEARAQLAQLHGALHGRNLELIDREGQLTNIQAEIATRDHAIAAAKSEAENRERERASQTLEFVSLRAELRDAQRRLDGVHRSWSWRMTAPARALLRLIRGY